MLDQSLKLACGAVLPNRLAKAAMTERLSRADYLPNDDHVRLYRRWSDSGTGLLITGNMMVDRRSMESAGNIAIDRDDCLDALTEMASAATHAGNHAWVQLGHPGRQTTVLNNFHPVSASDVPLKKFGLFARPRALSEGDIDDLIEAFATAASRCQKAGFTGVQVHSAHGYLISQFLSPLTNIRNDRFGGSLENRSRFLVSVIRAVRKSCGTAFPIAVKLNSADFQRGGFDEDESLKVMSLLEDEGVDLLEISGGTYEKLAFFDGAKDSTKRREAYFIDFAERARKATTIPLMVTGGFRSYEFAKASVTDGAVDVVGLARPFLWDPKAGATMLAGNDLEQPLMKVNTAFETLNIFSAAGVYNLQLHALARGDSPLTKVSPYRAAVHLLGSETVQAFRKKLA